MRDLKKSKRLGWMAASLLIALVQPSWAQEADKPFQQQSVAQVLQGSEAQVEELLARGGSVRRAFRSVVAETGQAIVRVKCEGKDAALGCVVGPDGWIMTKASLLRGQITCLLKDGRELDARLVGVHDRHDVAMLKIPAKRLFTVPWSDSPLAVGQWLATPGMGQDPESLGVVSVLEREIPKLSGQLGIQLADDSGSPKIAQVTPNSAAAKAGLLVADVITHFNGQEVKDRETLIAGVRQFDPGAEVEVKIRRQDEQLTFKIKLTAPMGGTQLDTQNSWGSALSDQRYGFPRAFTHDTVVKPTDCGGPLVNLDGRVVGINLARHGRTGSYAIATPALRELMADLMSGKLAPASEKSQEPTP